MDSESLVTSQIQDGLLLLEALDAAGIEILRAFWGKSQERERWLLYVVCPELDRGGLVSVYEQIQQILRQITAPSIELSDIFVVGANDSIAEAIQEAVKGGRAGVNWLSTSSLNRLLIEQVYVYPELACSRKP
jgi:hypothetical protein